MRFNALRINNVDGGRGLTVRFRTNMDGNVLIDGKEVPVIVVKSNTLYRLTAIYGMVTLCVSMMREVVGKAIAEKTFGGHTRQVKDRFMKFSKYFDKHERMLYFEYKDIEELMRDIAYYMSSQNKADAYTILEESKESYKDTVSPEVYATVELAHIAIGFYTEYFKGASRYMMGFHIENNRMERVFDPTVLDRYINGLWDVFFTERKVSADAAPTTQDTNIETFMDTLMDEDKINAAVYKAIEDNKEIFS